MALGAVAAEADGQCHLLRRAQATRTALATCVPTGPGLGWGGGETRGCGHCLGQAPALLLPPCGHEFSFLPKLSTV